MAHVPSPESFAIAEIDEKAEQSVAELYPARYGQLAEFRTKNTQFVGDKVLIFNGSMRRKLVFSFLNR